MINNYSNWILNNTRLVYVLCALITVVASVGIAQLTINSTPYIIDQSHPERLNEQVMKQKFTQTNEQVFVVLTPQQAITNEFLQSVEGLQDRIEQMSIVNEYTRPVVRVKSMTNSTYISNQSEIDFITLWDSEQQPGDLSGIQHSVMSIKRFKDILSDNAFSSLAISIELSIPAEDSNGMRKFLVELESIIDELLPNVEVHIAGSPVVSSEVGEAVKSDNIIFFPIITLLIAVVLWFSFKNIYYVIAPLCITTLTVIWVAGIMGFANISINIITVVLPVFLVTIAVADSIHYLSKIRQLLVSGESIRMSNIIAINKLMRPLGLTSITTALGFIALSYTHLIFVSQFGIFTAIGVVIAFFLTITLLPALSNDLPGFEAVAKKSNTSIASVLLKINESLYQFRYIFSFVLFFLAVVAVMFSLNISPGFSNINAFADDTKLRVNINRIHSDYTGTIPADILVKQINSNENIIDIDKLYHVEQLQAKLEQHASITKTYSIVDLFKEVDAGLSSGELKGSIHQLSTPLLNQYLILLQSDPSREILSLYDESSSAIRLMVFADTDDGVIWKEINNIVIEHSNSGSNLTYQLTGFGNILKTLVNEVVNGQITSLILSVSLIYLAMIFLFKSLTLGLIGVVPLVLTLLINFAFMALTNITLDIATALIVGITFGIGVDYSIHMIIGLRENITQTSANIKDAISKTLCDVAKPIVINTLSLTFGFIILLSSSFQPIQNLGLLISLSLVLCGLITLIIIPFLMRLLPEKFILSVLFGANNYQVNTD